jgi:hypothetical protein
VKQIGDGHEYVEECGKAAAVSSGGHAGLRVRWYVAYPLSLRNLEEMMHERGVTVDHSTIHRWGLRLMPVLERTFRHAIPMLLSIVQARD